MNDHPTHRPPTPQGATQAMDNSHVASAALSVLLPAPHCDNLRSQSTVSCMAGQAQYPECLPAPAVVHADGLYATMLSIQTPAQGHLQPLRTSLQQCYTLLSSPSFLPDVPVIAMVALLQQVQQQQQLMEQQLQLAHQQIYHMQLQLQYAQNIESPHSLLPSPPQTPSQQLGLLDDERQSIHTWVSESLENQDVWDQSQYQEELRMTDLLFTPEHLQISPPMIDQGSGVLHTQQSSPSTNEDLESTASERNKEKETHSTTKAKRTRRPLRVQRRLEIIAYWEMNKGRSMTELSKKFGIPRSTAYGIINDRQALKKLVKDQSHPGSALERYRVSGLRSRTLEGP